MTGGQSELLVVEGLTKAYPGVQANDAISFSVGKGEIHALLGENGAGKSTLVKAIFGLVRPDRGRMWLNGARHAPGNPSAARRAGVGMVFQHFSLFEALTVAENVVLGMEGAGSRRRVARAIAKVSQQYGLPLDPHRIVGELSAGERQRVEIIRCLLQKPSLLIMDEPTSVLTPQEAQILFRTLRELAAGGTSILYISHKLDEIRTLCDRATILRRGKVVASCAPRDKTSGELAELMVGASLIGARRSQGTKGKPVLEVKGLWLRPASPFGAALREVSLTLRSGEVLGIGGVAGNGQDELLSVLSGEVLTPPGRVILHGEDISRIGPKGRRARGLLAAPEERLGHAAVPDLTLIENATLTGMVRRGLASYGFINWEYARNFANAIIRDFDVRTSGPEATARSLSGGNLQKFVIGREVSQRPEVLVVNQPTWGVDAAAAAAIRQSLIDISARGAAVLIISQDLDELMEVADNFAALNEGRLSLARPTVRLTLDEIGLMMGGAHGMQVARVQHGQA